MQKIYTLGIKAMSLGMKIASRFNEKAQKAIAGRENVWEYLNQKITPNDDWVWVHCSSLGEFEQGRPVIEVIKEKYPKAKIAVSFFSPSGYEVRKNYAEADAVFYLPFDTPKNAEKLIKILKPKLWVLVKYDYWYNFLDEYKKAGVPIIVVSAIFRENQSYFKSYGKFFAQKLKNDLAHFFVQNQESVDLLSKIGISNASAVGDTRFDRVKKVADQAERLPWVETFKQDKKLFVVGSSWKEDEDFWVKWMNEDCPPDWKIIIAPHEMTENSILALKERFKDEVATYQKQENLEQAKILIVDAIGFLSKIYAYADIAYVGGGFNKSGVHNTLEPAVFGVPVVIGENYAKFQEVKDLMVEGALFSVSDYAQFQKIIKKLISEDLAIYKMKTQAVFNRNLGATQKIMQWIEGNRVV
ncbi:3-deoxy-D-manno-octulosonic acid transferase [Ornithobacterium rhinotracheale]|uniref:3-deoxy-D-manno-octulosonic acid transferase n=1 Tax=Ornithobacterium rhinotracheale TaxID=28251 RepID=UPI00129C43FA|nr:glycosyltransferase N-terminal domain-containing protein [Ornithobacterium rhinotracheale]MRI62684.1 3-deoxy-D-manno-octulosonic acid transferase [Ornithobacterium rhinotracheale]